MPQRHPAESSRQKKAARAAFAYFSFHTLVLACTETREFKEKGKKEEEYTPRVDSIVLYYINCSVCIVFLIANL